MILEHFSKICRENSRFICQEKRVLYVQITDHYTFMIISRSMLLTMRNVADGSCRENHKTFNFQ